MTRSERMRLPYLAMALACSLTAAAGCASPSSTTSLRTTAVNASLGQTAQAIVAKLQRSNPGVTQAAAYVETTLAAYEQALPAESRNGISVGSPNDRLLVVKVVGSFTSVHSEPGVGRPQKVSTLIAVYDETVGAIVENTYLSEPSTADVPNTSTAPGGTNAVIYVDLRALGQPVAMTP
jgi:hypothetical protein